MEREIHNRLQFLVDVGLEYLTLSRPAPSLSGGEMQRIRLAAQLGSGLCGVLYVLDEPTIGLHPRDNGRLLNALKKLRDLGNTLLVVEHDREVVRNADELLDFGPAAGRSGGQIVAQGTPSQVAKNRGSVTGPYLSGKKAIPVPTNRRVEKRVESGEWRVESGEWRGESGEWRVESGEWRVESGEGKGKREEKRGKKGGKRRTKSPAPIAPSLASLSTLHSPLSTSFPAGCLEIVGARHNNLKNIDVQIPLGTLTVVTGPSGSGKSSLIEDVLFASLARTLHRATRRPATTTPSTACRLSIR